MPVVEFHCHTLASKDSLLRPQQLLAACVRKGIDKVVVTDHNGTAGAIIAEALDPDRVIIGEEIMTARGEILAAFVKTAVPPGLAPLETISRLRDQGAFISVSHPFDRQRKGAWKEEDLLAIVPSIDAIEVFNSRCMLPAANRAALEFARRHGLAGTVGSDAHTAWELGRSVLSLPEFSDADDLRRIIRAGHAQTLLSPAWIHLSSRYARWRKLLGEKLDTPKPA